MPHWNAQGQEEWVCQKGAHICTGHSTWVEYGSDLAKRLGCHGNVCDNCLEEATVEQTSAATPVDDLKSLEKLCDAIPAAARYALARFLLAKEFLADAHEMIDSVDEDPDDEDLEALTEEDYADCARTCLSEALDEDLPQDVADYIDLLSRGQSDDTITICLGS